MSCVAAGIAKRKRIVEPVTCYSLEHEVKFHAREVSISDQRTRTGQLKRQIFVKRNFVAC